MADLHLLSLQTVRIKVLAERTKYPLTYATGFLSKFKSKTYLITNRHVVTGRNNETSEPLGLMGGFPGFLEVECHTSMNRTSTTLNPLPVILNIRLYDYYEDNKNEMDFLKPLWLEHPVNKLIDVVAIDITQHTNFPTITIKTINLESPIIKPMTTIEAYDLEKAFEIDNDLTVMDNVFIIGYPLKSELTPNNYPIYKGATIASEPKQYGNRPLFLVDGKTKSGMSGSPVVKKHSMYIRPNVGNLDFIDGNVELIGIYSGREIQGKDEYTAELGIVWDLKKSLGEILKNKI